MKKYFIFTFVAVLFFFFSVVSLAQDMFAEADALFEKGDIDSVLKSIPIYVKIAEENPNNYHAQWKCARAHREYANLAFELDLDDWKSICRDYGKEGMKYGKKAIELVPQRIEGFYYYGLCVGSYSDGVSILRALKEGLKKSTEEAFETAYNMDKMFKDGGPILCLGRFWHLLPFPLNNKKKALEYFEEHQKYFPDDPQGQVYLAELLIDMKRKSEAKILLEKALTGDEPYYVKRAKELLEDL